MERKRPEEYKLKGPIPMGLDLEFPWHKILQTCLCAVTVFPLRCFLLLLTLFPQLALASLTDKFVDPDIRPVGWRYFLTRTAVRLGQLQLFIAGIWFERLGAEPASRKEAPILVLGPHSTIIDAFCLLLHARSFDIPAPTTAIENMELPLMGSLVRICRPIVINRDCSDSKQSVIEQLKSRVHNQDFPQSALFPEGTNSNRRALMTFKPGAFIPGVPIQPIVLRFTGWDTYTWTFAQRPTNLALLIFLTLCQPFVKFTMEYLPLYRPNKVEKEDAMLFARNVREVMSKALDVPVSDFTLENGRLLDKAVELGMSPETVNFNFYSVSKLTGLNWRQMRSILIEFWFLGPNADGLITGDSLKSYCGAQVSTTKELSFLDVLVNYADNFKKVSDCTAKNLLYQAFR